MKDLTNPAAEVRTVAPLAELAGAINAAHQQADSALRSGLEHARRAGDLLIAGKKQVGHGGWLAWLKANVRFSERTAQHYMRVAARWAELTANPQPVADLTYRGAIEVLADQRIAENDDEEAPVADPPPVADSTPRQPPAPPPAAGANLDEQTAHRLRARDLFARGASVYAIARELMIPVERVRQYVAAPAAPSGVAQTPTAHGDVPAPLAVLRDAGFLDAEALALLLSIRGDYGDEVLFPVPAAFNPAQPLGQEAAWDLLDGLRPLAEPPLWPFALWYGESFTPSRAVEAAVLGAVQALADGMLAVRNDPVAAGYPRWAITATWWAAAATLFESTTGKDHDLSVVDVLRSCIPRWREWFQTGLAFILTSGDDADDEEDEELDDEKTCRQVCGIGYSHDLQYAGILEIVQEGIGDVGVLTGYPGLRNSFLSGIGLLNSDIGGVFPSTLKNYGSAREDKREATVGA